MIKHKHLQARSTEETNIYANLAHITRSIICIYGRRGCTNHHEHDQTRHPRGLLFGLRLRWLVGVGNLLLLIIDPLDLEK